MTGHLLSNVSVIKLTIDESRSDVYLNLYNDTLNCLLDNYSTNINQNLLEGTFSSC